jgi:hypothetical protein
MRYSLVGFARSLFKRVIKGGGRGEYVDWLLLKLSESFQSCGAIYSGVRRDWRGWWEG